MKRSAITSFVFILAFSINAWAGESLLSASKGTNDAAKGHISQGIAAYNAGDVKAAQSHFEEAVASDSKSAEAHFDLALVLHWGGKHGEAGKHFQHAKGLGQDNPKIAGSKTLAGHVK